MNIQPSRVSLLLSTALKFSALGLAGVAAMSIAACARVETSGAAPPLPQVTAAASVARDVTEWDEFTARLEPIQTVAVRPRVSGLLSTVSFEEGSLVRQGQVLFQIDDRPFQAQV